MSANLKTINNIERLQKALGYTFSDDQLLVRALSHRSVGKNNNERIEFLGDSLLNLFITEALFKKLPDASEGELTRLRAHLVKGETLADIAREFDLGNYLLLGSGELKSGGYRRDSILADTVEALIGAIYIESGLETSRQSTLRWYTSRLAEISVDVIKKDSKTRLQEYLQKRKKPLPTYTVLEERGELHSRSYIVECRFTLAPKAFSASATNKRTAEKLAAEKALAYLETLD